MTVADVQCLWPRHDTLGEGAAVADDQVVGAQIHPLEGLREERQERLMTLLHQWQPLHEARANIELAEAAVHTARRIDRGVDRRLRKQAVPRPPPFLAPPPPIQLCL